MSVDREVAVRAVEEILGVTFADKNLLHMALTHRSYADDNRGRDVENNERLEFLGDSILNAIIANLVYHDAPRAKEGVLSRRREMFVSDRSLGLVAMEHGLHHLTLVSKRVRAQLDNEDLILTSHAACTMEALIGAVFLDQGMRVCHDMVRRLIWSRASFLEEIWKRGISHFHIAVQARYGVAPIYEILPDRDHPQGFVAICRVNGVEVSRGRGLSKQRAKEDAAENASVTVDMWLDRLRPGIGGYP